MEGWPACCTAWCCPRGSQSEELNSVSCFYFYFPSLRTDLQDQGDSPLVDASDKVGPGVLDTKLPVI